MKVKEETEIIGEEIDINIKEKPDLKEVRYTFNTGASGFVEHITETITGDLSCVLISVKEMISIEITLADFPDVLLYKKERVIGDNLISLRNIATFYNDEQHADPAYWNINDKIRIKITGNYNTIIKLILRWK